MWPAIAAAAVGAIGGAMGQSSSGSSDSSYVKDIHLKDFEELNKGRSGLEEAGYNQQLSGFKDLQNLLGLGPGANEISSNTAFQNSYAGTLQGLMNNISNPNYAQNFQKAQQAFAPQQTALNQQFQQAGVESNRLAARLGRAGNDPVLRNKLMQEQTRQQTMLNSQIGAYGQQLPAIQAEQVMGVGNALSNLRQGLATQAMNNRQTMIGLGQQLANSERNYRIQTALQTGSGSQSQSQTSGGGLGGAISGAFAGFGAGAGMAGMFSGGGGGGGSAGGGVGGSGTRMQP